MKHGIHRPSHPCRHGVGSMDSKFISNLTNIKSNLLIKNESIYPGSMDSKFKSKIKIKSKPSVKKH